MKEEEQEPEDKSVSYADYLAAQAEKKLQDLGLKEARKPNEGARNDKKWANAKALSQDKEEAYFEGSENKSGRARERKVKEHIDIDYNFKPEPQSGRGRGRGGRGGERGGDRGDRPRGGRGRGDFESRGSFRGSRGEGGRGRGRGQSGVNVDDQASFPSLGAK